LTLFAKFRWFLAPSIFQAGVAFATLPLATLILGPQDYGAYALVVAITGLASAIACMGSSYQLAHVFSSKDKERIRQLVSQQLVISLLLSALLALLLIVAWNSIVAYADNLNAVPHAGFMLAAIGVVPSTLWAIALDVLTLDGRAKTFAKIVISQSLLTAAALLACLFIFDLGALSLFFSAFTGTAMLGLGAMICLWPYIERPNLTRENLQIFKAAFSLTGANIIEVAYQSFERNLLALNTGLHSLGLYTHAQQYRAIVATATKALSRSVWPITLEEAKQPSLDFRQTNRYWRFTYLCLGIIGISFAALGDLFIGLLTHGKFMGAGPYAAMSIAYLLVQNSGRPHTGLMYARGDVKPYARFSIIASIACFACAAAAIPLLGVWGALLSISVQQIVLRASIQRYTSRLSNIPFQDGGVIVGLVLICLIVAINTLLALSLNAQIFAFAAGIAAIMIFFYSDRVGRMRAEAVR
jgi:O-antigen/teichoic acid export membrane protein